MKGEGRVGCRKGEGRKSIGRVVRDREGRWIVRRKGSRGKHAWTNQPTDRPTSLCTRREGGQDEGEKRERES